MKRRNNSFVLFKIFLSKFENFFENMKMKFLYENKVEIVTNERI